MDAPIALASAIVTRAVAGERPSPVVRSFFDEPTFTATHVVHDPVTLRAAIIDSVLDFDTTSGHAGTSAADAVLAYVASERLVVDWLLETPAHADHLSAARYLQQRLGGKLAIGSAIVEVQSIFGKLFNAGTPFPDCTGPGEGERRKPVRAGSRCIAQTDPCLLPDRHSRRDALGLFASQGFRIRRLDRDCRGTTSRGSDPP